MQLGSMMRTYRREHGITQADLAKMLGVTRCTVMYLEQGKRNPSVKLARKISAILGESLDILLN